MVVTHSIAPRHARAMSRRKKKSSAIERCRREDAAQTRQAEELTRLTRRAAIRGPLPSDQPTDGRCYSPKGGLGHPWEKIFPKKSR
jgi:hypothetical protein